MAASLAHRACDAAPNLWEHYARGPESGDPPGGWETELVRPLLD